ncbi:hypothetical protein PG985_009682 [Apiospora marii]
MFMQDALTKSGGTYEPIDSIEFSVDTNDETSNYDFGQTTVDGKAGFTYGGWFSFGAGGNYSDTSSRLETGSDTTQIKFKILFDKMETISITPGSWNFDVSGYSLRPDSPKEVRTLVRPSQLVVVTQLGYEITLAGSSAVRMDEFFTKSTSVGGSMSIFGVPISVGGSGSMMEEKSTHKAHWDAASNTLKVVPKDDSGTATVVGIVGEKFNTVVG